MVGYTFFVLAFIVQYHSSTATQSLARNGYALNTEFKFKNGNKLQKGKQIYLLSNILSSKKNSSRFRLVMCACMYGSNYAATKLLQRKLSAQFVTVLRFLIALLASLPGLVQMNFNIGSIRGGIEIGLWCSLGYLSQAISLQYMPASKVALMCGLGVLIVPLIDLLATFSPKKIVANFVPAVLAFAGVTILEVGQVEAPALRDLLLLVTPLAFGFNFWRAEKILRRYPDFTHLITTTSIFIIFLTSLLWSIISADIPLSAQAWQGIARVLSSEWKLIPLLAYLGLAVTAWASHMEQNALKVLSATETTLIYTIEPLSGAIIAALTLSEKIGPSAFLGGLLILCACSFSAFL